MSSAALAESTAAPAPSLNIPADMVAQNVHDIVRMLWRDALNEAPHQGLVNGIQPRVAIEWLLKLKDELEGDLKALNQTIIDKQLHLIVGLPSDFLMFLAEVMPETLKTFEGRHCTLYLLPDITAADIERDASLARDANPYIRDGIEVTTCHSANGQPIWGKKVFWQPRHGEPEGFLYRHGQTILDMRAGIETTLQTGTRVADFDIHLDRIIRMASRS